VKPFLFWRNDWLVGHKIIDRQHLEIVNLLNALHYANFQKHKNSSSIDTDLLHKHLQTLIDTARRHFRAEESLMMTHQYSDLAAHHREHVLLLAELQECVRDIDTDGSTFTLNTLTALKHWLIEHVTYSDQKFVDSLRCKTESDMEPEHVMLEICS
jgi:hemerythrin